MKFRTFFFTSGKNYDILSGHKNVRRPSLGCWDTACAGARGSPARCPAFGQNILKGGISLYNMIGKRRKLLDYLMAKDIERYRAIIAKLGIRK